MKRTPLVAGNWKMHHTRPVTRGWCATLRELLADEPFRGAATRPDLAVAAPFTSLETLRRNSADLPVHIVAQNCHHEPFGAFTGEVSAEMLKELGCEMVIVGHSERRQLFGETDKAVGRKTAAVARAGMIPILCVGESGMQRDSGRTEPVIEAQLRSGLETFTPPDATQLIVAYEPVWAIGTGQVATPSQAEQAHAFLRGILASIVGRHVAAGIRILYGGSVKPGNARELAEQGEIDGFLVGGASLDPSTLLQIGRAWA